MILCACGHFSCLWLHNLTKHTEISYTEHIGWLVGWLIVFYCFVTRHNLATAEDIITN